MRRTLTALSLIAVCLLSACGGGGGSTDFTTCGNGRLDKGEACDDGNLDDTDACNSACQVASCGDGVIHLGVEDCEGRLLNGGTCATIGLSGVPVCDSHCHFDYSVCGSTLPTVTVTPTPAQPTSTGTPSSTPTPTRASACGDGLLSNDETCTSCPADCTPQPCTPGSDTVPVQVSVSLPDVQSLSPIRLSLAYRTNIVALPSSGGFQGAPGIIVRATNKGYFADVLLAKTGGLSSGLAFTATFDRCTGAAPPTSADFACQVTNCAGASGCTCSAAVP